MAGSEHQNLMRHGRAVWRRIKTIASAQIVSSLAVMSIRLLSRDPDKGTGGFLLAVKVLEWRSLDGESLPSRHAARLPCMDLGPSRGRIAYQSASPIFPATRFVTYVQ